MNKERLKELLEMVANGSLPPDEAVERLKSLPFHDLGFAKIDLHRSLRQGTPEVIFCPGKTAEQVAEIATVLRGHHDPVLATRANPDQARQILELTADAVFDEKSRTVIWGSLPEPLDKAPTVAIVAAGTSDIPVAEEAAVVLSAGAVRPLRLYDVGVAGIHRLLGNLETLNGAAVTIVAAGMDGALPSVIGGLLPMPVIAVPTSVGYGASFQGVSALLTMLNSCAAGMTVVNIDNGFGAAMAAIRILSGNLRESLEKSPGHHGRGTRNQSR